MTFAKVFLTASVSALLLSGSAFAQSAPAAIPAAPATTVPVAPATTAPVAPATTASPSATPAAPQAPAVAAPTAEAEAPVGYTYTNAEGEYAITLPDAPSAQTIWGDQTAPIPYLEKPPRFGSIGETAEYHRVNEATGEFMNIQIVLLKADRDFLLTRTPDNMQAALENDAKGILLDDKKFKFVPSTGTIKRMSMTGFSVDKSNNALYNAFFYLTGNATMMVVRVQYSIENKEFNSQYQQLFNSIQFIGK